MLIRTSCKGCCFNSSKDENLSVCEQGMETSGGFVSGFCKIKRTESTSIDKIKLDESRISVIYLAKDRSSCQIIDFIDIYSNFADELIVLTYINDRDKLIQISNRFRAVVKKANDANRSISWNIKYLNNENKEYDEYFMIDECSKLVKTNWFAVVNHDQLMLYKKIRKFKNLIDSDRSNSVVFYTDEQDNINLIVNRSAFHQINGNIDIPFFEKIKSFDNWKDSCQKI